MLSFQLNSKQIIKEISHSSFFGLKLNLPYILDAYYLIHTSRYSKFLWRQRVINPELTLPMFLIQPSLSNIYLCDTFLKNSKSPSVSSAQSPTLNACWLEECKAGQCPLVGKSLDVKLANTSCSLASPQISHVLRQVTLIGLFPFIISFKDFYGTLYNHSDVTFCVRRWGEGGEKKRQHIQDTN